MPANHYILPVSGDCQLNDSWTTCIDFPVRQNCFPIPLDGLLVECGEGWNSSLCSTDRVYFHPYQTGKKIQIQTAFADLFNPDPANPVDGFGVFVIAELIDCAGNVITNDHTTFSSRYFVGWSGEHSYQNLEIDTALISANYGLDCFSIRFTSFDGLGNEVLVCTQEFKEVCNNKGIIEIQSTYSGFDCKSQYYGEAQSFVGSEPFLYENTICLFAQVLDLGGSFTKEVFSNRRKSVTILETFLIELLCPVPPYVKNVLLTTYFSGETVFINGESYDVDSFSIDNVMNGNNMYLFSATLTRECENNFRC